VSQFVPKLTFVVKCTGSSRQNKQEPRAGVWCGGRRQGLASLSAPRKGHTKRTNRVAVHLLVVSTDPDFKTAWKCSRWKLARPAVVAGVMAGRAATRPGKATMARELPAVVRFSKQWTSSAGWKALPLFSLQSSYMCFSSSRRGAAPTARAEGAEVPFADVRRQWPGNRLPARFEDRAAPALYLYTCERGGVGRS
jgi:hypothetical protein